MFHIKLSSKRLIDNSYGMIRDEIEKFFYLQQIMRDKRKLLICGFKKNIINRQFRRNFTLITPNKRSAVRGRRIPTSTVNSVGVQPASGLMGRGGGSITPSCPPAGVARGYPCMSPFGDGNE